MYGCLRPRCSRPALADWWLLCAECSIPLLDLDDGPVGTAVDQRAAAGWDALGWAERIAPDGWGSAVETDPWVVSVRCLAMASVVTARASGYPHTVGSVAVLVVAVARMSGVLRCPPCAETVVARSSAMGPSCDRCGSVAVVAAQRVAALIGSSMILVAQLCCGCRSQVLALAGDVEQA
jgi:ribosomal protein L37AE/L43A